MKFDIRSIVATASVASLLFLSACDWSSGSQDNFNTSGGSTNVNVSGFYRGAHSGGRAVARTSGGSITSMTIQQSGNRVDVYDNQGSVYEGTLGTPLLSSTSGSIQPGQEVSSFQISFSGKDNVAGRDINFTGTLTIVAVTEIQANESERDTSTSSPSGSTTTSSLSTSEYELDASNNQLQLRGTWSEVGGITSTVNAVGPPVMVNFAF